MSDKTPLEVGQTWVPTKPGSGWRMVTQILACTDGRYARIEYSNVHRSIRRAWGWQFSEWIHRYECELKEPPA